MFKYKVLLVDDEEEVTNMIEERIDWAGLGFEVAARLRTALRHWSYQKRYSRMW